MTKRSLTRAGIARLIVLTAVFMLSFCVSEKTYAETSATTVFANHGYAYGKGMAYTSSPMTFVAELADGVTADTIQWQESDSKTGTYTDISGANSLSFSYTPKEKTWYRCVVNGVSTIPIKVISYAGKWYITNDSMAYMVYSEGDVYRYFNAVGWHSNNWQQTSYSSDWQLVTSDEAEPTEQRCSNGEGNAKLDAFRISFDEDEPAKMNVEVDLESTQRAFSFGADVQIGDYDSAPLNAVYKNGVAKQVQMVAANSRKEATDDTLSLVLDYVQTPSKYWLGTYGSRQYYAYNIYHQESFSPSQYPTKVTDQGTPNVISEVTGIDSGMTSSWMNLDPGSTVEFRFNVGKVSDTGAMIGTDSLVTSDVITYKSLKAGYEYKLQTSTDGESWTDVEGTDWVTPDAEGKLVYGAAGTEGVTGSTTVTITENTRYKLICRKTGSETASDVAGGDVTTNINPTKPEADKPEVSADVSADTIRFCNLRTEFQYALIDSNGKLVGEYASPQEDGSLSFSGLHSGTDYYLVAKDGTNQTSDQIKYTTQKAYVIFEDNVAGEEILVPEKMEKVYGNALTLPMLTSTRNGYSFAGWTTVSGGANAEYLAGGLYTVEGNTTLYAVWKADKGINGTISIDYTYSYEDAYHNEISGVIPEAERPSAVKIVLVKTVNGLSTEVTTKEFTVSNKGNSGSVSYDFGVLPQYENGQEITYSYRQTVDDESSDYVLKEEAGEWHLYYNPSVFNIEWDVTTNFEKTSRIIDGIRIKITYKNDKNESFKTISQHENTYYECFRQADGSYSGVYPVLQYNQLTKKPYLYSLEVVAYKADDEWHEASELLLVNKDSDETPVYYNGTEASGKIHVVLSEKKKTITFDENYGENPKTTEVTKVVDEEYVLPTDIPERNGYDFAAWNTKADGSGKDYAPGSVYQDFENVTFYAKWKKKEYPVVLPDAKETEGIAIKGDEIVKDGDNYIFTITGKGGYSVEDIVITVDGTPVDSKNMKYDSKTNTWTITVPNISQAPSIKVTGVKDLKPEIEKETNTIQNSVKEITPKNGTLFSDLKNLTSTKKNEYTKRINAIVAQAEKQFETATSDQQVEAIRSSAVSQIKAIYAQAQAEDKREADKKKTVTPTPKPIATNKPAAVDGNSLANRKDLPILLAKGKGGNKKIMLSWIKVNQASGYEVYWSYCNGKSNFKQLKDTNQNKQTHSKLSNKKKYKYFVIAYRMVSGKKVYIAKSNQLHVSMTKNKTTNAKALKVKKAKVTLKKGKKFTIKAKTIKEDKKKKMLKHAPAYRYYSANKKVATVNKKGIVTAKKKGKCILYVLANNGAYKKIEVRVK